MNRRTHWLMIAAAAAALAALAAAPASARIFYVVQSSPEAWTVMDPDGIGPIAGVASRRAWAVRVQRNILSGNPPQPGYVRTLSEYDCQFRLTRWREFTAFSRSGVTLVSKVNPQPTWKPAAEIGGDTLAAYRIVCEGGGGAAVVSADSLAKVVISLMGSWDPPPAPAAAVIPTPPGRAAPTRPVARTAPARPPNKAP